MKTKRQQNRLAARRVVELATLEPTAKEIGFLPA